MKHVRKEVLLNVMNKNDTLDVELARIETLIEKVYIDNKRFEHYLKLVEVKIKLVELRAKLMGEIVQKIEIVRKF